MAPESEMIGFDSLKYLKAFPKGQKSLVFSQFTKFLSAIEPHLKLAGIRYVRFDGSMSAKKRAETIDEFQVGAEVEGDGYDSSMTEESDSSTEDDEPISMKREKQGKGKTKGRAYAKNLDAKGKGRVRVASVKQDPGPTVMLISLKSGSVGLNLTAAQVRIS